MIKRNENIKKLRSSYLFPEINKRKREFLEKNPNAKLISLGVGDTTEPIPHPIVKSLSDASIRLGTLEGYVGYGPEQGLPELRKKIAEMYYKGKISPDEIFISDGAKCDIGRLQFLFGSNVSIAVQDPSYPVYVDGSVMMGLTAPYDVEKGHYPGITYMKCSAENNFFPDLSKTPRTDLIYFCSPNNPTGAVATKEQLEELVAFARKNRSIVIYDGAYGAYIRDPKLPKSIFEIEGAEEIALETNSFSKIAGFTGVRLGWTAVPEKLKFEDGSSVRADWNRVVSTIFNGAPIISQYGGIAVLDEANKNEIEKLIGFYLENAAIIREVLENKGFKVYGGVNAPYLWVHFPGRKSWEVFQEIMDKVHVVTTPGAGFGPGGEGFIRMSSFGHRDAILEAATRLKKL